MARSQLLCHIARQHFYSTLHCGIGRKARHGEPGQPRRNIQDASAILHEWQQLLGKKKRALEMDLHEIVELLFGSLSEGRADTKACVIDQEIEVIALPLCLQDLPEALYKPGKRFCVGDIQRERSGLSPGLFDLPHNLICVGFFTVICEDNIISSCRDMLAHTFAQPAASAGYKCDFNDWFLSTIRLRKRL